MSKKTKTKKETPVKISTYQKLAMRTCMPSCRNVDYAYLGLCSEIHELKAKIAGYYAKEIRGDSNLEEKIKGIAEEVGDCFWFVALGCEIHSLSFASIYKLPIKDKKDSPYAFFVKWLKIVCAEFKLKPIDCMRKNIRKLARRAKNNKIIGDGDGIRD